MEKLSLKSKDYILVTAHRKENVDDPISFQSIINGLGLLYKKYGLEIIYPMHPRTQSKLKEINMPKGIRVMNPLGYYDFNFLTKNAFCLVSDSGTSAEEGLYYKVPCVSVRKTTERPETVEAGSHIIAGINEKNIVNSVETIVNNKWTSRYDMCEGFEPSTIVINTMRRQIQNYF